MAKENEMGVKASLGKNGVWAGIIPALLAIAIVFAVEQVFTPGYAVKSVVKVLSFTGAIAFYCACTHRKFSDAIRLHRMKNARQIGCWMLCFFVGTATAFLLFRNYIDLQGIRQSLMAKENMTKDNCLFVFAYIIVCNSFLEESFFRGFISGVFADKRVGCLVSAILFSLYHIGIFITWFDPVLFLACLAGLAGAGVFLQWLCQRFGSILASYITHACANIAINIIGALLIFEMI